MRRPPACRLWTLILSLSWCPPMVGCASKPECACSAVEGDCLSTASSDPTGRELRAALAKARATTGERVVFTAGWQRVDGFQGRSKGQILAMLGRPDILQDGSGQFIRPAQPCHSLGDWLYLFYHLPSYLSGRGPELHIRFGADDKASAAWWANVPREGEPQPPPFQLEPSWESPKSFAP
jgi:hypothetical protein